MKKSKCRVIFALVLAAVIALGTAPLSAKDPSVQINYISTTAQLKDFVSNVNGGSVTSSKIWWLVNDIVIDTTSFSPIGTAEHPFMGTFIGNRNNISLVHTSTGTYNGLFGYIKNAEVSYVNIGGSLSGGEYIGGIAAYADSSKITCCTSNVTIFGETEAIGGIVGKSVNSAILQCEANGSIAKDDLVGISDDAGQFPEFKVNVPLYYDGSPLSIGMSPSSDIRYTSDKKAPELIFCVLDSGGSVSRLTQATDGAVKEGGAPSRVGIYGVQTSNSALCRFEILRRTLTAEDFNTASITKPVEYDAKSGFALTKIKTIPSLSLTCDVDYTVAYTGNTMPSAVGAKSARVTISGIGGCEGSVSFDFAVALGAGVFELSGGRYILGTEGTGWRVGNDKTVYSGGTTVYLDPKIIYEFIKLP